MGYRIVDLAERARILVERYKSVPPPENVSHYLEPTIFVTQRILVSRRSTHDLESDLDLLLPLEPTIFMTQRNSERRSTAALSRCRVSSRKSIFLWLKNLFR